MREIKFRAWEKNLKEIIPVHNIDFKKKMINIDLAWRRFNEIELLQYTGLQDKNGKEIYEGDILAITYKYDSPFIGKGKYIEKGVVEWKGYSDWEYVENVECWMTCGKPISDLEKEKLEVIGNIYQDSELLEVKS